MGKIAGKEGDVKGFFDARFWILDARYSWREKVGQAATLRLKWAKVTKVTKVNRKRILDASAFVKTMADKRSSVFALRAFFAVFLGSISSFNNEKFYLFLLTSGQFFLYKEALV